MDRIIKPGLYADIPATDYHGAEICDGPSISSSGLKLIEKCPLKYWVQSPLNPDRVPQASKRHFSVGNAAHHFVMLGEKDFFKSFHVTPSGFSRAKSRAMADEIAAADEAEANGLTVISADDYEMVKQMAYAVSRHPVASAAFTSGIVEPTLAWKHDVTGVWLRCRPDFFPHARLHIPDYKTAESVDPARFERSAFDFGYHQSAALYMDGIEAVFGERPKSFFLIAQEKSFPYVVEIFAVDSYALDWGRRLNERAIRIFAECLHRDVWPTYGADIKRQTGNDVLAVSLPRYAALDLESQAEAGLFDIEYETPLGDAA